MPPPLCIQKLQEQPIEDSRIFQIILNKFESNTSIKTFINLLMKFNELAATFDKLSRRLDGFVTKAEIETWACESLWCER